MKTFFKILMVFLLFVPFMGFTQVENTFLSIPNKTTVFGKALKSGKLIFLEDSSKFYKLTTSGTAAQTMATVFAAGTYRQVPNQATTAIFDGTLFAAGNVGIGTTAYNKLTVEGTSGNTVIAGTLTTTGSIKGATLKTGLQTITQDHINNTLFNNSVTATDTLFAPIIKPTTNLTIGVQTLTQNNVNNVLFNNAVTATDSLKAPIVNATTNVTSPTIIAGTTLGVDIQTLTQNNINNVLFNNSIEATDSIKAPVVNATTKLLSPTIVAATTLGVGIQTATQNHVNNIVFNNSITATDTLFTPTLGASGSSIKSTKPFIIGTGTVADSTSCIYMWSPDGSKFKLSVTNSGLIYMVTVTP